MKISYPAIGKKKRQVVFFQSDYDRIKFLASANSISITKFIELLIALYDFVKIPRREHDYFAIPVKRVLYLSKRINDIITEEAKLNKRPVKELIRDALDYFEENFIISACKYNLKNGIMEYELEKKKGGSENE